MKKVASNVRMVSSEYRFFVNGNGFTAADHKFMFDNQYSVFVLKKTESGYAPRAIFNSWETFVKYNPNLEIAIDKIEKDYDTTIVYMN